jgi:hypothetical protein
MKDFFLKKLQAALNAYTFKQNIYVYLGVGIGSFLFGFTVGYTFKDLCGSFG